MRRKEKTFGKSVFRPSGVFLAVICSFGLSGHANAAPVFYSDLSAFLVAASGTTLEVDDFGTTGATAVTSASYASFGVTSPTAFSTNAAYACSDACISFSTTADGLGSNGQNLTFSFAASIVAFGLTVIDAGNVGNTDLRLEVGGVSQILFDDYEAPQDNVVFVGVIDLTQPFSQVVFNNTRVGDFVMLENLQFADSVGATIPIPGSLLYLSMALVGLYGNRRSSLERR